MAREATFGVDPRLASILGENYRSTEQAIKELIDNAWDADAAHVWITLPDAFTTDTISVRDDGCGMTESEIRTEYLKIASDRRVRKGDRTPIHGRLVKGRKGIGKFAGFTAADVMDIRTLRGGVCSRLQIVKRHLLESEGDLESVGLPLESEAASADDHGTEIVLSKLNQRYSVPMPEVLKELLALEYSRQEGFRILVNDEPLEFDDIPGRRFTKEAILPNAGRVRISVTVLDGPAAARQTGMVTRVDGKIVGRPTMLGLEDRDDLPGALRRRIVGEIEADGLTEAVTPDWGGLIENSMAYQEVVEWSRGELSRVVDETFSRDIALARGRQTQANERRLAKLPENRRRFATQQIERIVKQFYNEPQDRVDAIVSVVLDALEHDEYWLVCWHISQSRSGDVVSFAEALGDFGLLDMAVMAGQITRRLEFLTELDGLIANAATLEGTIHTALASNLWVFGVEYAHYASNQTLGAVATRCSQSVEKSRRSRTRPDLLLAQTMDEKYLLIEFKRPSETVGRKAEAQAKEYRDDLRPILGTLIDVLIVGGKVDAAMTDPNQQPGLKFVSYSKLISSARRELDWLLEQLQKSGA